MAAPSSIGDPCRRAIRSRATGIRTGIPTGIPTDPDPGRGLPS